MPTNLTSAFPHFQKSLEAVKLLFSMSANVTDLSMKACAASFEQSKNLHELGLETLRCLSPLSFFLNDKELNNLFEIYQRGSENLSNVFSNHFLNVLDRFKKERTGEVDFIDLFTDNSDAQDWSVGYEDSNILLDLPGLRVIDISTEGTQRIHNYAVVFAPRAGHHSNIAERVALHLRDQGLTRMAVVEQKCADDIPTMVEGKRHMENFEGHIEQYKEVLTCLKALTGYPSHLIAVCQPGPLLISTLILNPELGKTFGSAGSPMDTDAKNGFLTDFARMMGEKYIDMLVGIFGRTPCNDTTNSECRVYDGTLQVMGFYYMGMDQHMRNFKRLLADLKSEDKEAAERQQSFYKWYNVAHHFPACFIRDTYKKIFIRNALINDGLKIGDETIHITDYPDSVPIWALGGSKDEIAPPLQAVGHLNHMRSVPPENKLNLICDGGHMGLFRSKKILHSHYSVIAKFILDHSDIVKA